MPGAALSAPDTRRRSPANGEGSVMDERRRFDRRRPSDADITAGHNAAVRQQHIAETAPPIPDVDPLGGDDAASLPEAVEPHATEPTPGGRPDSPATRVSGDPRERVLRALRAAVSGGGRGRGTRYARAPMPDVVETIRHRTGPPRAPDPAPTPDDRIAETHGDRGQLVRDVTQVQISEQVLGAGALVRGDPHWSERDNRARRYQDPGRTDQE
jgi:hypothetical protein